MFATSADSDGDGIPDTYDPYPSDPDNNTAWWTGDFLSDGTMQHFGGAYRAYYSLTYPEGYGDADTDEDGILDVFDPYPQDPDNNTSWWFGGYTVWVDGVSRLASGTFATTGFVDSNEDGIFDALMDDADQDSIPDIFDPYPNDPNNNTSWWHGGEWLVDGSMTSFDDLNLSFATLEGDQDGDGIPDLFDPYLLDPTNNTSWWDGGNFWIDGIDTLVTGGNHATAASDADGDGIPDVYDTMVNDATNNTSWWDGRPAMDRRGGHAPL